MKTIFLLILLISTFVFASNCEIITDRKACPGKDAEMLRPYKGENPTTDLKVAKNEADCKKIAAQAVKIIRKGVLSSKKVVAKFDGKEITTLTEKKSCD